MSQSLGMRRGLALGSTLGVLVTLSAADATAATAAAAGWVATPRWPPRYPAPC